MIFQKHSDLVGKHALLSASKSYWLNYSDEQIAKYFISSKAAERGTELHAFAAQCIRLKQRLPRSKKTLNMYVNDAISFNMTPEQILFYSENCFGTTDAISFRNRFLRIHDYKSGEGPVRMDQLMVYSALFCLEYRVKPSELDGCELRIYQSDDILYHNPCADEIEQVCDKIVTADKIIVKLKIEEA